MAERWPLTTSAGGTRRRRKLRRPDDVGVCSDLLASERFGSADGRSWALTTRVPQLMQYRRGHQDRGDGHDYEHRKEHRRKDAKVQANIEDNKLHQTSRIH